MGAQPARARHAAKHSSTSRSTLERLPAEDSALPAVATPPSQRCAGGAAAAAVGRHASVCEAPFGGCKASAIASIAAAYLCRGSWRTVAAAEAR